MLSRIGLLMVIYGCGARNLLLFSRRHVCQTAVNDLQLGLRDLERGDALVRHGLVEDVQVQVECEVVA